MFNALLSLVTSLISGLPAGSVLTSVVVTITGTSSGNQTPQSVTVAATALAGGASFANLPADSYSVSFQNLDQNGKQLGSLYTGTFALTAPATISLQLVTGATVTQSVVGAAPAAAAPSA